MEKEPYQWQAVTLAKAEELIIKHLRFHPGMVTEELLLLDSLGRLCAKDIIAPMDQPPFHRSPLDGYAIRAADTAGASKESPVVLQVVEERMAGDSSSRKLGCKEAVMIMTGAPIPPGANCVVAQESTDYGERMVSICQEMQPGENFCYAGEDVKKGDCLILKGTKISAIEIGLLASMGYERISVWKNPQIALFTTGDELAKAGEPLAPGKIYNANRYLLHARLKELGMEPHLTDMLPDDAAVVAEKLKEAARKVDLIITTGGVSVGKKDIMHEVFTLLHADKIFWQVAIKPGAPTIFALVDETPVISLSGTPVGAITNLELLVRPALAAMSGRAELKLVREKGIMMAAFPKESKRKRFIRGIYQEGKVFLPKGNHPGGALSSMIDCNCLIEIEAGNEGLAIGDVVKVVILD